MFATIVNVWTDHCQQTRLSPIDLIKLVFLKDQVFLGRYRVVGDWVK